MLRGFTILCFAVAALLVSGYPQRKRVDTDDYAMTLTKPEGTIQSAGYPNGYGYNARESWKLRVPDAEFYTISFHDMDLDVGGCYDYIVVYDDSNYIAPGEVFCGAPTNTIVMNTDKVTISFVVSAAGYQRGDGFSLSYATNRNVVSTTTTTIIATTTEVPSTSEIPSSTTTIDNTPPTTSPVLTATTTVPQTTTTTIAVGGNFPPGEQDDSNCGVPAVSPQITGFDYEAQQKDLSSYLLPNTKVVNGEAAVPHSWPWQVSLQGSYGSAYCGGTLIREQLVVTAAHCAALIFIGTYGSDQVALGIHNKQSAESSKQLIDIVDVYVHPSYDNPDRSHDVAVVKMARPAELNDHVSLACEAHPGWTFPAGMQCVVTGWGVTVEGGNRGTSILQQAPVKLMGDQECYDLYQQANLDTTTDMQCAGGEGKGACNGDSGGPLSCFVNNRWYHMGIVSFGEANCDTTIASIYARVTELRGFIDQVVDANM